MNDVGPCFCQQRADVSDDSRLGGNESLQLLGVGKRVGDADHCGARRLGDRRQVVKPHLAAANEADSKNGVMLSHRA